MQETYNQIKALFESFDKEHNSGTKAGAARARKAIGNLKKLVTQYNKESVAAGKAK